jgi:hypothetical protein
MHPNLGLTLSLFLDTPLKKSPTHGCRTHARSLAFWKGSEVLAFMLSWGAVRSQSLCFYGSVRKQTEGVEPGVVLNES